MPFVCSLREWPLFMLVGSQIPWKLQYILPSNEGCKTSYIEMEKWKNTGHFCQSIFSHYVENISFWYANHSIFHENVGHKCWAKHYFMSQIVICATINARQRTGTWIRAVIERGPCVNGDEYNEQNFKRLLTTILESGGAFAWCPPGLCQHG